MDGGSWWREAGALEELIKGFGGIALVDCF